MIYTFAPHSGHQASGTVEDSAMEMLGGYRVVRKLGSGSRAEVWLGSDGSSTAAIKVFGAQVEPSSIDAEIEALGRAHGRHVVQLKDLASGPDGMPCLIFPRLSTFSLSRLLSERRLAKGEAVTILAPLALTLADLHENGVAHRAVTSHAVLFDESGAPVLTSFGRADVFGDTSLDSRSARLPPAVIAESASVAVDGADMASLCRLVLGDAGVDLLRGPGDDTYRPGEFLRELAERLFSLAVPTPVSFNHGVREGDRSAVSARVDLALDASSAGPSQGPQNMGNGEDEGVGVHAAVSGPLALFHLPDSFVNAVRSWLDETLLLGKTSGVWGRVAAVLRPVRTSVWIIAGVVVVAVVAFTALAPTQSSVDALETQASNSVVDATEKDRELSIAPGELAPRIRSEILGDDPIAAGEALLLARNACFEAQSVLCLDGVNQPGSASMEADSYQIRLLQSGGIAHSSLSFLTDVVPRDSGAVNLSLVDSLGNSVLFSIENEFAAPLAPRATMLIVRGDEGWRIRDLVVTDPEH